jgi:hypothetical protein
VLLCAEFSVRGNVSGSDSVGCFGLKVQKLKLGTKPGPVGSGPSRGLVLRCQLAAVNLTSTESRPNNFRVGLPRETARSQPRVCQNSNFDLYIAAFRVGSCDFVDHSFWPRKEGRSTELHELTQTKTPRGNRVLTHSQPLAGLHRQCYLMLTRFGSFEAKPLRANPWSETRFARLARFVRCLLFGSMI